MADEELSPSVNVTASTNIDPNANVPDAVKRAARLAESFYQPTEAPAEAPEAAEPSAEPAPEAAAPSAEPAPEAPTEPNWEHRYHSMKGRVDKQDQVINSLLGQVQQLSEPPQQQPPRPRPLVTEEERKAYGEDLLDVVARKALEVTQPHIEQLTRENQQLRQRLGRDEARTIYDILAEHIPNWSEINTSSEFLQWLSLPDPYSGQIKAGLLKAAFGAGEAGRVLAFFRGFLEEHPELGGQSAAPQATPAAQAPKRQAAVQLRDLAAPGKARPSPGGTQVPVEPAVITNKDLDRFYADVRRNVYAGRPEVKAAEEARLHAAVRDGRVRIVK